MKLSILIFSAVIVASQINAMETPKISFQIMNKTNEALFVAHEPLVHSQKEAKQVAVKSLDLSAENWVIAKIAPYNVLEVFNLEKGNSLSITKQGVPGGAKLIDEKSFPQLFTDKPTSIFTITSDSKGELVLQRTTDPRPLPEIIKQEEAKAEEGTRTKRFSGFGQRLGQELNVVGREEFIKDYEKEMGENIQLVKMLVDPSIKSLTPEQVLNALQYKKLSELSDTALSHLQTMTDPVFGVVIENETKEQENLRKEKAKVIKPVIDTLVKKKKIINKFVPDLGDKIGVLDLLLDDKITSIEDIDVYKIFGYYTVPLALDKQQQEKIHRISELLHDLLEPYIAGETKEQAQLRNKKAAVIRKVFQTLSKSLRHSV